MAGDTWAVACLSDWKDKTMDKVLAKSPRMGPAGMMVEVTLAAHTRHVVDAANALFGSTQPSHLGVQWLRFFRIQDLWEGFQRNLVAASALHDWGKANDTFQKALIRQTEQAIRHEHLSVLLMAIPHVREWIESASVDFPLILSAVLTHHLKASDRRDGFAQQNPSGPQKFRLIDYGGGFQATIDVAAEKLGLTRLSVCNLPEVWEFEKGKNSVWSGREKIQAHILQPYWQFIRKNDSARRMLQAVRSALIAADSAGSGMVRTQAASVGDWVERSITRRALLSEETVNEEIIEKRRAQLINSGQWTTWNDFQKGCDHLPDRALLLAPCGSGKTLAAWRWIAARLKKRPAGHAIFLYPTRATAREGFQDYVSWAPEADAALMHGTSHFDLDGMFENAPENDERRGRNYEAERRLYALAYWPRRVFSATVDQFLAFMQYSYGPMCMLPVLVDSVVVVDEVHSFDNSMFSALKDFLKAFDVPVLCMTATLPKSRRVELVTDCGLAESPEWPDDLKQVADSLRYQFRRVADRPTAESAVRDALNAGKRVLWVVNQVKRVHEIVATFVSELPDTASSPTLRTESGVPVVCYHSRFRLRDRVERHSETMKLLKGTCGSAALGVTTQVCEMSLDIDVDLLVTEECPVSSLVQRMGRCNRNRNARPLEQSGHVLVYPPENNDTLPYNKNDLTGLPEFLNKCVGRDVSQSMLDDIMQSVPSPTLQGDKMSRFVESGPYAVGPADDCQDGFRDSTDFSRQAVLTSDLQAYTAADQRQRPGFIVPVPANKVLQGERRPTVDDKFPGWLAVAPDEYYHAAVGFLNYPISEWTSK